MRAGEIFNLTWDKVDLKEKAIKLEAADTKTSEPRVIFLNEEILEILKEAGKVQRVSGITGSLPIKGSRSPLSRTCFKQCLPESRHQQFPVP